MNTLTSLSIGQLKQAVRLREKIDALHSRLSQILPGGEMPMPFSVLRKKRKMSAAGRRRIAAAQKLRWAKQKGKTAKKGRRKMSAAGRAKISAAATARWAKMRAMGKK